MIMTVTKSMFIDEFASMGRENQFSYAGKVALFEYFEAWEQDTGTEIELDVIGICCEFTEYENIKEYNEEYGTEYDSYSEIDETTIIPVDETRFIAENI